MILTSDNIFAPGSFKLASSRFQTKLLITLPTPSLMFSVKTTAFKNNRVVCWRKYLTY